jgi:hypothetical protein
MGMVWIRTPVAAAAVVAVTCAVASGCTITIGHPNQSLKVSKDDLQKDISQRLNNSGQPPQSVKCPNDLVGQLGQSIRCDVTMGSNTGFEAVVTVTSLEGSKVNYDVSPSVSTSQLEASVSQLVAKARKAPPDSVSCQSGLEGKVGAVAYCDLTARGTKTRRSVEVSAVSGLQMTYGLIPVLPKAVVESSLVFQLRQIGQHPDSVSCADDLQGKVGNTGECMTTTAGRNQVYILTVTAVQGENITYKYTPKP